MQLNVREVASLMGVSEKTIYRWIKHSKLPAYKINEQYRFSRAELLEWATAQRINVSVDLFREPAATGIATGLAEAIRGGGIHYRVGGSDKPAVLKAVVDVMQLPEEVDKAFLLEVLLARESLGSTAIGNGIAIPHMRNPIVQFIPRPTIGLCFLECPIDFGALDAKPVHTMFTIVSPTISAHLNLLSRLSFALRQPAFSRIIASQGTREEIMEAAERVETGLMLRDRAGASGREEQTA